MRRSSAARRGAKPPVGSIIVLGVAMALGGGLAIAGCNPPAPSPSVRAGSPEALAAYLQGVVGADAATRQREAGGWLLGPALWDATMVAVYRPLYPEYRRAFAAELPALVDRLAHPGPVTARRHFAGDPRLTPAEARDRWALPTLFPSLVAEAGGAPIDAVFVADGAAWRALVGLDQVVLARVAALDPGCAAHLALAGPPGHCTNVGAAIADAALRGETVRGETVRGETVRAETLRKDGDQLAHVCRLAETLCGKGSP
jgi:GETHR pentapeptide repeat (5 copies)